VSASHLSADDLIAACDRDGFVVVRNFFDKSTAEKALQELDPVFDAPDARKEPNMALCIGVPGRSPTLDQMFEKILTDPLSTALLEGVAGKYIMARDINARKMTGVADKGDLLHQALQWHRDGPGEFEIAIILKDVEKGGPGTGFVKGSHKWASDPQWDVLLGRPFYPKYSKFPPWKPGLGFLTRLNPFSRALYKKELAPRIDAAYGKSGDFYIFIGETWHNRMNNTIGAKSVVVLGTFFATDQELTPGAPKWPAETIAKVPPTFAKVLARTLPKNAPSNTVMRRALEAQNAAQSRSGLFVLAKMERRIMATLSLALQAVGGPAYSAGYSLARAGYRAARSAYRLVKPAA
jgi:ectoine hydroxylase-related dioxygenase (phytanoyl-CoA dioxygenase family)